jgi:hypothetical protein
MRSLLSGCRKSAAKLPASRLHASSKGAVRAN